VLAGRCCRRRPALGDRQCDRVALPAVRQSEG
jgi:hypothetical protein